MRRIPYLLNSARLAPSRTPVVWVRPTTPTRRLDDALHEIFDRACAIGDAAAAADVLAVLEKWHARRRASDRFNRRADPERLRRARLALERLRGAAPSAGDVAHARQK